DINCYINMKEIAKEMKPIKRRKRGHFMMDFENTIKRKKAGTWKAVVTILFLCMTVIASDKMPAGTVQAETSGDYEYRVNDNGTTVTITKYTSSDTTLVIPSTLDGKSVTSIGQRAFANCDNLTSITIPVGVISIGERAFAGCSSLTSITIPEGVTTIGDEAFVSCSSLTSITIPESVIRMWRAFVDCSSLTSIQVKSGNQKYDSRNNCNAIIDTETNTLLAGCCKTIIPESITTIGDYSFAGCNSLTSITIPEGVTTIKCGAFYLCSSLTSITIPSSVTTIEEDTFMDCSSLTSITIPEGVTTIQPDTFSGCSSLTNITIPSSVTAILENAFSGCSNLTSITVPSNVTRIGDNVFSGCPNTMIVYADADSRAAEYAKASGFTVKPIEKKPTNDNPTPAASGTILTVSDLQCTVKVVSDNATNPTVTYTGTTSKTAATVTIPATVTVDNITYKVTGIAENAFKNNKKITKVTIGANITTIGANAFNGCTKLKTVSIGANVTTINAKAFYKCTKLTKITIPAKVETIGKQAFYGCKNLKNITIKTTKLTNKKIGSKAFKGIHAKATIKVPKKKLADYKKILKKKGVGSKAKIKK
ncbi:MAG: leucine-rich repeat domain-containing protein, partial [Lachnospiraceae bacterium]|nr:leucine-rich repeat domain-containing protein [Lachnospiraceae bacterium]